MSSAESFYARRTRVAELLEEAARLAEEMGAVLAVSAGDIVVAAKTGGSYILLTGDGLVLYVGRDGVKVAGLGDAVVLVKR